jgi:hypothetical protein
MGQGLPLRGQSGDLDDLIDGPLNFDWFLPAIRDMTFADCHLVRLANTFFTRCSVAAGCIH